MPEFNIPFFSQFLYTSSDTGYRASCDIDSLFIMKVIRYFLVCQSLQRGRLWTSPLTYCFCAFVDLSPFLSTLLLLLLLLDVLLYSRSRRINFLAAEFRLVLTTQRVQSPENWWKHRLYGQVYLPNQVS